MLLDCAQGVETLALSIAVQADISDGNLLSEVLDQSLKVNQVLNIRDEEAMSHSHVADVSVGCIRQGRPGQVTKRERKMAKREEN